tara:strand:- start:366 stop:698 length:333 start_codon:yes stop_codon:yes gene_type:complete
VAVVAAFVTVGHAWHTVSAFAVHAVCMNVPSAHAAEHVVHVSACPTAPTVLKYPAAHADTLLSLAEAQVYDASVAALSTVGQTGAGAGASSAAPAAVPQNTASPLWSVVL